MSSMFELGSLPTAMPSPTALPRLNLHDMLVASVRELIARGEMRPGDKISEQALCKRFDVSRTPLREALKVLAAEGIVQLRPRQSPIVARISGQEIEELFPIMAALEELAGQLLCKRITDAEIGELRAIHDRMVEEYQREDEPAYLASNRLFHQSLFAMAGNPTLEIFYNQILARTRAFRFVVRKSEANWKLAVEDHVKIIEAIESRDARRLPRLLRQHVLGVTVQIARATLEDVNPAKPARRSAAAVSA
jgi:DNA-binding GntR family transcriptional regulator